MNREELDVANAEFWSEPCGTNMANALGIGDDLKRFDEEFFKKYPYLEGYLAKLYGEVVEVGLGFGSVGQMIDATCEYLGVDIADGPLDLSRKRKLNVLKAPANDIPLAAESIDCYVSIGCWHHTGYTQECCDEALRLLKPGGRALVMLYNSGRDIGVRDADSSGTEAPHTDLYSDAEVREIFKGFSEASVDLREKQLNWYIEAIK